MHGKKKYDMKKLIMINGTMGAGKSTVCKALHISLPHSVWLDGDWCWMADPFVVNEDTKAMVMDNICYLLNNFLKQKDYEHIIFCWVMDEQYIIEEIIQRICATVHIYAITLRLKNQTLIQHLQQDIDQGVRKLDCMTQSLARQQKYEVLNSIKIDIDDKDIETIVQEIETIVKGD